MPREMRKGEEKIETEMVCQTKTMVCTSSTVQFRAKHVSCIVTNSKDKNVSVYELQTLLARKKPRTTKKNEK